MANPVDWNKVSMLTPGMKNLGNQFNKRWPNRDGASDGAIGDYAHSQGTSGHNPDDTSHDNAEWDSDSDNKSEVRAIDVDNNLNDPLVSMQNVIDHMRKLPGLSSVIRYMIYNRKIYKASNGFNPETYTGASPHTEHAHFSGAYSDASDENTSFNFKFDQLGDTMSVAEVVDGNEEYNRVTKSGEYNTNSGGRNVWDFQDIPNPLYNKKGPAWQAIEALSKDAIAKNNAIAALTTKVDTLTALVESHVAGLVEGK